jgi:uncharacterized protein (DUF427 family)
MRAVWNGNVVAESDDTLYIEGNHYFPSGSVDQRYLRPSRMRTLCLWKGLASYYTLQDSEKRSRNAAWTYRHPLPWIRRIRDHVAFWGDVEVLPD